ncbi:MAG: hypothetical protein ACI9KE_002132 [Polyangiales bacterium]
MGPVPPSALVVGCRRPRRHDGGGDVFFGFEVVVHVADGHVRSLGDDLDRRRSDSALAKALGGGVNKAFPLRGLGAGAFRHFVNSLRIGHKGNRVRQLRRAAQGLPAVVLLLLDGPVWNR